MSKVEFIEREQLKVEILDAILAGENSASGVLGRVTGKHGLREERKLETLSAGGSVVRVDLNVVRDLLEVLSRSGVGVTLKMGKTGNWTGARVVVS